MLLCLFAMSLMHALLAQEAINAGLVERAGLGYLLMKICHVESDKEIACSDWRERPLPAKWLAYSVLDVLYLPYVATALIKMLLENNRGAAELPTQIYSRHDA
jgi:ribonuclease D